MQLNYPASLVIVHPQVDFLRVTKILTVYYMLCEDFPGFQFLQNDNSTPLNMGNKHATISLLLLPLTCFKRFQYSCKGCLNEFRFQHKLMTMHYINCIQMYTMHRLLPMQQDVIFCADCLMIVLLSLARLGMWRDCARKGCLTVLII